MIFKAYPHRIKTNPVQRVLKGRNAKIQFEKESNATRYRRNTHREKQHSPGGLYPLKEKDGNQIDGDEIQPSMITRQVQKIIRKQVIARLNFII